MALTLVGLLKVFSALVLIVSTSSNSLLLLVFYRRPGLRTLSNRFVMNLLVSNLASSWILVPLTLWDSGPLSGWAPPLPATVWHGLTGAVYAQSVLSVITVAVDQYYAVTDPLRYHVTVNAASCAVAVAVTWCLSAAAGALSAVSELEVAPRVYRYVFPVAFTALLYALPFVTVCVVYVKICTAAHRNSERARRNGSVPDHLQQQQQPLQQQQQQQQQQQYQQQQQQQQKPLQQPLQQQSPLLQQQQQQQQLQYNNNSNSIVNNNTEYNIVPTIQEEEDETPEAVSLQAAAVAAAASVVTYEPDAPSKPPPFHHSSTRTSLKSTSSSIVNHLRYRISNASMFRYREETRAAKISALVIVTAAACWTPYAALKLSAWPPLSGAVPSPGPLVALLSLSAHAVITPVLFAHRNRRVHRELCRVFCRRKRCSSFYDNVRNATVASSVAAPVKPAAGPQHVFGRWFGRPGGTVRSGGGGAGAKTAAGFAPAVPAGAHLTAAAVPSSAAAHLPTDTDMARSSFSSNGSATTQASSVITVD